MHSSPTSSKFISRRWERNWPTYSSSSLPSPFKSRNVNDEEQCDFDRGIALSLYQVYLSQQGSIESINVFPYQCWIKDFRNETNLSSSGNEMDKKKRNLFRTRFAYNYVSLCMYIARKSIWPDHWFEVSGNVSPLFSLYFCIIRLARDEGFQRSSETYLFILAQFTLPSFLPPWSTRMLDSMLESRLLPSSMVYLFIENSETFAE